MQSMRIVLALLILLGPLSVSASEFDETKALAEQGDADAQFALGYNYYAGIGAQQDYKEALKWYQASAAQG
ncbi:MAG: SEL1-like repeat protein, partial [Porticoccaceae bacterium]|nr:SEL1-like repeat protein [Porticoccaceae bacterium]